MSNHDLAARPRPAIRPLITIRSLEPGDRDAWQVLWRGYQVFYKVEIADATTALTWDRILDPGEPVNGAIALLDGRPVGIVHWIFHRSTWTSSDYCYLQDLYVSADSRSNGAGRALIEHVVAAASAGGSTRLYWLTHETNDVAIALYGKVADRSGFIQYRKLLPTPA